VTKNGKIDLGSGKRNKQPHYKGPSGCLKTGRRRVTGGEGRANEITESCSPEVWSRHYNRDSGWDTSAFARRRQKKPKVFVPEKGKKKKFEDTQKKRPSVGDKAC